MLNSHTHCQVAPADPQAKTWQRVCLSQRSTVRQSGRKKNTERTTAVLRNGECSASYDSFVVGSSAVLRLNFCAKNPPLRQAAKRYAYPLGIASERPQLIPAFIEDKNGHILPYVKFDGGSLTITDEAINVLNKR